MKSMTKVLIAGAFIAGLALGWVAKGDEVVVSAQTYEPFMMKRIYTGADGLSHVEQVELDAQSVLERVTGAVVRVSQPGSFSDWHNAPSRRYIINLTGGGQLEVAEGKVDLPPGTVEYIDDLTGKGHTTANVGQEPRVSIHLEFEDQQQIVGPIGRK
jgi:quercetin dioxygenase-like cupin family protein